MEDSTSLVKKFLQKTLHDRQHVIDRTYELIRDYNNGDRLKAEYERTLRSICTLLGQQIPDQVLVYMLTLVDVPLDLAQSDDGQLKPLIEKIRTLEELQKTQNCLTEDIKGACAGPSAIGEGPKTRPQGSVLKTGGGRGKKCGEFRSRKVSSLLDLAAVTVVRNHSELKKTYQRKFEEAWTMVNSDQCGGALLEQCYETLRDLNRKRKLLRDIENDNITEEVVADLYQDVDIFLREKHVYEVVNMDFFECASQWSMEAISGEFT
ncbi:uncharacterized protein [Euwallacea fornicatus]|uniref:uncharacterized protein n=1 Tax=Euwallacea fornicatus TaxID=995702 RepID=UPI00338FBA55